MKNKESILTPSGLDGARKYQVMFYDHDPVIAEATSMRMAEVLAKAYIIHKYKVGWDVHKVVAIDSGLYVGGSPEKSDTSF